MKLQRSTTAGSSSGVQNMTMLVCRPGLESAKDLLRLKSQSLVSWLLGDEESILPGLILQRITPILVR